MFLTGKTITETNIDKFNVLYLNYSWTTAICNDKNECIDVHVVCRNGKVESLEPVSELVKYGEDWKDPRIESNFSKKLC